MFNIFIHHETVNVAMICLESELTPRHNTTRLVHIMYTLANYICEYWEISWGVSRWGFYLTIYVGNPPGVSRLAGGQPPHSPAVQILSSRDTVYHQQSNEQSNVIALWPCQTINSGQDCTSYSRTEDNYRRPATSFTEKNLRIKLQKS